MKNQILITDFIPVGHESAVKRSYLVEVTHLTDRRLRELIEIERINGTPIINVGNGYYIADKNDPVDVYEVADYMETMRGRIHAMQASAGALTRWLADVAEEVLNGR